VCLFVFHLLEQLGHGLFALCRTCSGVTLISPLIRFAMWFRLRAIGLPSSHVRERLHQPLEFGPR
jgi:hypothetical protein